MIIKDCSAVFLVMFNECLFKDVFQFFHLQSSGSLDSKAGDHVASTALANDIGLHVARHGVRSLLAFTHPCPGWPTHNPRPWPLQCLRVSAPPHAAK